ncbi:transglutaminase-like domain-containing protein [Tsuneonella sp. HG222]
MPIAIDARFSFDLSQPTDVLLQFEAADIPEQEILACDCQLTEAKDHARVPAQDSIGERVWLHAEGHYEVAYTARVEVKRILAEIATLNRLDPHELPGEAVEYLFDSRYCPADRFQSFVSDEFADSDGGARIEAIRDWVASHLTYTPGSSDTNTTALDTFVERHGICRDYAHLVITLARASTIPARYVSVYAPGVEPPDFHAVAEVFLADPTIPGGGAWHLIDATGMADPAEMVKIGVGRDAADVAFMTVFGNADFGDKTVSVRKED